MDEAWARIRAKHYSHRTEESYTQTSILGRKRTNWIPLIYPGKRRRHPWRSRYYHYFCGPRFGLFPFFLRGGLGPR